MRALLDVNVLIALLDAAHVHHHEAREWMGQAADRGWASCPITQNGCVRILSSPAYPGHFSPGEVATRLRGAMSHPAHTFWPDDVNLLDQNRVDWRHILGHRQITDTYLLALAVAHKGRFVTFDQGISPAAVPESGRHHLTVLCQGK